jgi:hypothetical protein
VGYKHRHQTCLASPGLVPIDCTRNHQQDNGKKQFRDTRSPPSSNDQVADAKCAEAHGDGHLYEHRLRPAQQAGGRHERRGTHYLDGAGTPCLVGLSKVI